jgi:hypothetical protein
MNDAISRKPFEVINAECKLIATVEALTAEGALRKAADMKLAGDERIVWVATAVDGSCSAFCSVVPSMGDESINWA